MFMTAYINMVMNAMKAKMKLIIVKNDFSNVKMVNRAPGLFSSPRLIVTLTLSTALDAAAAQYHQTAMALLTTNESINSTFDWLRDSIFENIDESYNVAPDDLVISRVSAKRLRTCLDRMLVVYC